tara:strand:+ start:150 stop:581 length:432 start_codon:yes stop_codon:yes gene_type:complete
MHIKIVSIGKIKEKVYKKKIEKYLEWLSRDLKLEIIVVKVLKLDKIKSQIEKLKKNNFFCIFLSEHGQSINSNAFSKLIFNTEKKIAFIIGGPEGHPENLIKTKDLKLSLSKMTMPYELATLVLTEQIYRALSIQKGSKYHRN